jgi:hypothetical protein
MPTQPAARAAEGMGRAITNDTLQAQNGRVSTGSVAAAKSTARRTHHAITHHVAKAEVADETPELRTFSRGKT